LRPSAFLVLAATLCGCASSSSQSDVDPEALYPWGASRTELETQWGAARLVWVGEQVPDDEFAAATMREMVSLRKPRPRSYQVFLTRRLDVPQGYFHDYVFYGDSGRVIYVARRK
jgi:hypothetical protein